MTADARWQAARAAAREARAAADAADVAEQQAWEAACAAPDRSMMQATCSHLAWVLAGWEQRTCPRCKLQLCASREAGSP